MAIGSENLSDRPHMILVVADRGNEAAAAHSGAAAQPVPPSSGCLFCGRPWGQGRRSDEHVLPRWMRKHETDLLKSSQTGYSAGFDLDDQARELVELPTLLTTKKSSLLTLKTREVCVDCNNGWMSRLEQAARPLIHQLAEAAQTGQPLVLTVEEAKVLALWCQKTATTYELTSSRPRVVTTAMGQQLAAGTSLRGSLIWLARHPRDYDLSIALAHLNVSATHVPQPGEPDSQIALVAIVYHSVSFLIFITDKPGQQPPPLPLDRWSLLWPVHAPVEYPPLAVLNGNELTKRMIDHSDWLPLVDVSTIRRLAAPPQVRHRN
jgi:hypothetical protein